MPPDSRYSSLAITALIVLISSCTHAGASSLSPDPLLSELDAVRLTVSGGLYDPPPGVDVNEVRRQLKDACVTSIAQAGLLLEDSAPAHLSIVLHYFSAPANHDVVGVFVAVDLYVKAQPTELESARDDGRSRAMSLWGMESFELAPSEQAAQEAINEAQYAVQIFLESWQATRE